MDTFDPTRSFIRLLGHVDRNDLAQVYGHSDLLVFASTCENLPNTVLEAMASGLPVVVADRRPMSDVIGQAGLTFRAEDVRDLGTVLSSVVLNDGQRLAMSRNAVKRAGKHRWTDSSRSTLDFIRSVAETAQ